MAVPKKPRVRFWARIRAQRLEEHFIFNEGSSKPTRDDQVIRVAGDGLFFEFNIEGNYKLCR